MNPEKIEKIFWCIIVAWFILRACLLGCQYFGNTDPIFRQEILKYFSEEDIQVGRAYALSGFWFKAFYGAFYVVILILMLRLGFFGMLWDKLGVWFGEQYRIREYLFPFCFLIILQSLSFPSSLYFGYLRESAAGFSNVNLNGWLWLYFKSAALNVFLQGAFLVSVVEIIRWFPNKWPMVLPLISAVIVAVSILLMPVLITPIFYNESTLQPGELREKIFAILDKAKMDVKEIYVVDESRYSKHTNAFFSGFGSFKRIVLYDNLIKSHTADEAALIFAHEAGHWKHNHMTWGLLCGLIGAFCASYFVYFVFDYLAVVKWFGLSRIDSTAIVPFFMISYIVLQLFFAPIESQISQYMETQADKTSIELTGLKEVFQKAEVRLAKDNKSDLLPHPFRVFWLYSHPIAIDRIRLAQ